MSLLCILSCAHFSHSTKGLPWCLPLHIYEFAFGIILCFSVLPSELTMSTPPTLCFAAALDTPIVYYQWGQLFFQQCHWTFFPLMTLTLIISGLRLHTHMSQPFSAQFGSIPIYCFPASWLHNCGEDTFPVCHFSEDWKCFWDIYRILHGVFPVCSWYTSTYCRNTWEL